jgi:hypothetical protein
MITAASCTPNYKSPSSLTLHLGLRLGARTSQPPQNGLICIRGRLGGFPGAGLLYHRLFLAQELRFEMHILPDSGRDLAA